MEDYQESLVRLSSPCDDSPVYFPDASPDVSSEEDEMVPGKSGRRQPMAPEQGLQVQVRWSSRNWTSRSDGSCFLPVLISG